MEEKVFISKEQALKMLRTTGDRPCHVFSNMSAMMIGCDWPYEDVIKHLDKYPRDIQIASGKAKALGHQLYCNGYFFETIDDCEKVLIEGK